MICASLPFVHDHIFPSSRQSKSRCGSVSIFLHLIRTHDRSRQAAVDLRLRPRGHWDGQLYIITINNKRREAMVNLLRSKFDTKSHQDGGFLSLVSVLPTQASLDSRTDLHLLEELQEATGAVNKMRQKKTFAVCIHSHKENFLQRTTS
jgi:hypothetical protein